MLAKRNILIVEDDLEVCRVVAALMEQEGARLTQVHRGAEAEVALGGEPFDLVLLDLNLPDQHGLDILRSIRQSSMMPVIVLTARSDDIDQVLGLELGADDYVTKPFSSRVLLARMNNVLRHWDSMNTTEKPDSVPDADIAGWGFDAADASLVSPSGDRVPLTGAEYRLLRTLLAHRNRAISRQELSLVVLGRKLENSRSVDALVARLRVKVNAAGKAASAIRTVHGVGYGLFTDEAP
ncbi:MAG: response regulator transcription factor [Alphaproteobacteria bacterium]|nr:response regulator transcription factor [Alphaproteobacteria bacterium]